MCKILLHRQERIAVEKQRLASIRLPPADPLVQAASATSGQPVTGVISLEEVLRRPHVHYP
jgi:tRNA uridine 5-carboxymethylaminomethyl modification enzyme